MVISETLNFFARKPTLRFPQSLTRSTIICLLSLILALWSAIKALERTSGSSVRSGERERKEFQSTLERVMEKAIATSHEQSRLAQIHASERINQVNNDSSVEKRAMVVPSNAEAEEEKVSQAIASVEEVVERFK